MTTQKEINKVYSKYKKAVNMTATELRIWSKNSLSRQASLSREPITRNIRLLSKPKTKWTQTDLRDANKTISYLARAKGIERIYKKNNPKDKSLTKNRLALRNWAYDVFKK